MTLTVSKGCPTIREASPPTPPANKLAPGDALSLSKVDRWDTSGVWRGGVVELVQGGVLDLVVGADDDLEVVGGDKDLLRSKVELVSDGLVSACAEFVMVTLELAIATFISRTAGCVGSEQGQAPWACL